MKKKTILVAGGDMRYLYTARTLSQQFETYVLGFDTQTMPEQVHLLDSIKNLPMYDGLVLPMPVSDDGLYVNAPFSQEKLALPDFLPAMKSGAVVFGGKFGKSQAFFRANGIETTDYLACEEFAVRNAVPTAEGAVQTLLEEMPRTIYGSNILVTGFGRIAKRMAEVLHALGADVTVTARNNVSLIQAEMLGCRSLPLSEAENHITEFEVICNTIPAKVITKSVLNHMNPETLILDLASKPGGVDWETAQKLGRKVVWALSLPGKTAPATAGEIIAKTILHLWEERRTPDV